MKNGEINKILQFIFLNPSWWWQFLSCSSFKTCFPLQLLWSHKHEAPFVVVFVFVLQWCYSEDEMRQSAGARVLWDHNPSVALNIKRQKLKGPKEPFVNTFPKQVLHVFFLLSLLGCYTVIWIFINHFQLYLPLIQFLVFCDFIFTMSKKKRSL